MGGAGDAVGQGVSVNSYLDWNFLGSGARARGMGGAFLGISDDADAASWNPAGLIYNDGLLMSLNYSMSRFNSDVTTIDEDGAIVQIDGFFGDFPPWEG